VEKISEDSTNYNWSCLIKFGICNIRNHYNKVLIVQIECIYGPVFVVGVKKIVTAQGWKKRTLWGWVFEIESLRRNENTNHARSK